MSLETKKVNVKGREFVLTELAATESLHLLASVSKALGEPMGSVLKAAVKTAKEKGSVEDDVFFKDLTASFQSLNPDEIVSLVERILGERVGLEGKAISIDRDFTKATGGIGAMLALSAEVLKFNFSDFFGDLGTLFQALA